MVYTPRKCSLTNRIVGPKDHAAVQFNIANVDKEGVKTGAYKTVVVGGYLRKTGEADARIYQKVRRW